MRIIYLEKTTSTEDYLRDLIKTEGDDEDIAVVASIQTGGKGTKGRTFYSKKGGIYLSILKHQHNLEIKDSFKVCQNSSIAIIKTLLSFNIKAQIKWPNDIYVNGKKICGMLIENKTTEGFIDYSLIGIGLNVNNILDEPIQDIATSMQIEGYKGDISPVLSTLISNLSECEEDLTLYKKYSCVIDKDITINQNGNSYQGKVKDILDDGRLLLYSGEILSASEITLIKI